MVVVDDEPLARTGVAELLRRDPELEVVGELADGRSAVEAIERLRPDIALLDVQMPELTGFEVLEHLEREHWPVVVFITAFDQFAVKAFEVHALDYLVKPFNDARFGEAVARAKEAVRGARAGDLQERLEGILAQVGAGGAVQPWLTRIVVKTGGRVSFVRVDDLDWIEAADYCVKLHAAGRSHVIRESMHIIEGRLDPAKFFRMHRSAIVHLDRIRELQPDLKGELVAVLHDGTRLRLSRTRRADLEARLGQPL